MSFVPIASAMSFVLDRGTTVSVLAGRSMRTTLV
jgi:hypothetical protein